MPLSSVVPVQDIAENGWTHNGSISGAIYSTIDDVDTINNNDFAISPNNSSGQIYRAKLESLAAPLSAQIDFRYTYRVNVSGNTINLKVRLYCNTTLVKEITHTGISATWTSNSVTLSTAEKNLITDPDNVYIELEAYQ